MRRYGLIGFPLAHSFSKRYFTDKFQREGIQDASYDLFPLEDIAQLADLIQQYGEELRGLNVTIPHKQSVISFLDELDTTAEAVGAVNTIRLDKGQKTGFNTDVIGFEKTLLSCINPSIWAGNALVLGSGGASKAVQYVLGQYGLPFTVASRHPLYGMVGYEAMAPEDIHRHTLIIQTTPLGMSPAVHTYPVIPYEAIGPAHVLIDLVYNPERTAFLEKGKQQGAQTVNGLAMLFAQAEAAWQIWNNT